jgi:hypothetical protein
VATLRKESKRDPQTRTTRESVGRSGTRFGGKKRSGTRFGGMESEMDRGHERPKRHGDGDSDRDHGRAEISVKNGQKRGNLIKVQIITFIYR